MQKILYLLFVSGCACAQVPTKAIRKDSIPEERTWLAPDPNARMPVVRPNSGFYRDPHDGPNVVRSTLDNMPVKGPDTSITYTMPSVHVYPKRLIKPPNLKIYPNIIPKN